MFRIGDEVVIVSDHTDLKLLGQTAVVIYSRENSVVINNNTMEKIFRNSAGLNFSESAVRSAREYKVKQLLKKFKCLR